MTLIDIQNQILFSFLDSDVFVLSKEIPLIEFDDSFENQDEKIAVINLALLNLEKAQIISKISSDKWILNSSFESNTQVVEIGPETASMLALFVNTYSEASNIEGEKVNILSIKENDIQNACHIGNLLLNVLSSKSQENTNN